MYRFSEKSLISLGDYYVYGFIDPRTKQIFYIGKSIAGQKLNQSAQNPITYLNPRQRDKILI